MSQGFSRSITRGVCAAVCLMAAAATQAQTVTKITLGPNPALVGRTVPAQMRAWATYSNGAVADVSSQVTWSSASGQSVISATGLLTSVANGSDTIKAALGPAGATVPALSVVNSDNQTATAAITVGASPVGAAVNPLTNKIYIANSGSNNVTVIDGLTNTTTTIPAGASPSGVAVNPVTNRIYVSNQNDNSVTVIDGAAGTTATVSTLTAPSGLAVNPVSNQVFVICKNGVSIINGSNNQTVPIPLASFATSVAVNPATNTAYVPTFSTGIAVIDGNTQTVTATIPLALAPTLSMIAVDPALNRIYGCALSENGCLVFDGNTNQAITPTSQLNGRTLAVNPVTGQAVAVNAGVKVYNPSTNSVTSASGPLEIPVWNAVAVNPVTGDAYVLSSLGNTIGVLNGTQDYSLTSTIAAFSPIALTINPATNRVYVVNQGNNSVTVVDGASNQTTNLPTGTSPFDVQVNPYTNKAYFVNTTTNNVSVVDGATNNITTVPVGASPAAAAVNPLTDKIYVANQSSNNVTVIDGATDGASTIATGQGPFAVAVNPLTDQIYVANTDGTVTIIAGGTGGTTSVKDGITGGNFLLSPFGMALNTVTNKLYIPYYNGGTVTILDGTAGAVSSVPVGTHPAAIAVNSFTNQIYVANFGSQNVTVIDGATSQTTTVPLNFNPSTIGVNRVTGLVYVAGINSATNLETVAAIDPTVVPATVSTVSGIVPFSLMDLVVDEVTNQVYAGGVSAPVFGLDGETNAITLQSDPFNGGQAKATALAVNPLTHQIYTADSQSGPSTMVLAEEPVVTSPLNVSVASLPGNITTNPMPTFVLTAVDGLDSGLAATQNVNVFYRFDSRDGAWSTATPNGNDTFAATPAAPLPVGMHVLLTYATNGREGTMAGTGVGLGNGDEPVIGQLAEYLFFVQTANAATAQSIVIGAPLTSLFTGATEQLTATIQLSNGATMDATNTAKWQSSNPAAATISGTGLLTPKATGSTIISATLQGLTATQTIASTTTNAQLVAVPSLSTDGSGNYVVELAFDNPGNITLTNISVTSAQLGSTTAPFPKSISLVPDSFQAVFLTFPASAGAPATGALLRIVATYTVAIPDGPTQQSSLSANFRLILP